MTRGFGHHGQRSIYICLTGKGDFGQLTIRLESVFFPESQECRAGVTPSSSIVPSYTHSHAEKAFEIFIDSSGFLSDLF